MKKKLLSLVLTMVMVLSLAACGAPKLEGTYISESLLGDTTYSFTKEGNVHVEMNLGNITVFSQDGTYAINDDSTEITFTFGATETESSDAPLSGTYKFQKTDTSIIIDNTVYNLNSAE